MIVCVVCSRLLLSSAGSRVQTKASRVTRDPAGIVVVTLHLFCQFLTFRFVSLVCMHALLFSRSWALCVKNTLMKQEMHVLITLHLHFLFYIFL